MLKSENKIRSAVAVFDLDGTLVETDAANSAAYRDALNGVGVGNVTGLYGRITAGEFPIWR